MEIRFIFDTYGLDNEPDSSFTRWHSSHPGVLRFIVIVTSNLV